MAGQYSPVSEQEGSKTYSALSTTTAASCSRPRGSSFSTLTLGLESSASLIVLIAASRSRVSYLGFGRESIKFQTLGKAALSRPGKRFAAPNPVVPPCQYPHLPSPQAHTAQATYLATPTAIPKQHAHPPCSASPRQYTAHWQETPPQQS
jgi:hypothetical protein